MSERIDDEGRAPAPLPSFRLDVLKTRQDFKDAAGGPRYSTSGFTMLRRPAPRGDAPPVVQGHLRFGFTVTKKVGNAVERNRIRRRLREAVRKAGAEVTRLEANTALPGMDLVILARRAAIDLPFKALVGDIARAIATLAAKGEGRGKSRREENPPESAEKRR
jgi:ribonuclease P protein component